MPRANSSVPRHRRHRKLIKKAKGYFGTRKSNFRTAKDAVQKALQYAYRDRRQRKRNFRRLWIIRINAAVRMRGLTYSKFISLLNENNIELNRKSLAYMAVNDPDGFTNLIKSITK
jgi:large subunit ribosomal protein L20